MARYYTLTKGTKALPLSGGFPWPYEISLCFDEVAHPVGISEGVGHGQASGHFSAVDALGPTWSEHFICADGEWLLPYVREIATGRAVQMQHVIEQYRIKHGSEPESYESVFT